MEWKNRITVNFGFKRSLKQLFSFVKSNIVNIAITTAISVSAVLITSFSIVSSSLSTLENVALQVANLAKDSEEERVHLASILPTAEAPETGSKSNFFKAHSAVHSSFLNYSVAAFRTRNNFYNVPATLSGEEIVPVKFECSFLDSRFSISALVPPTTSLIKRTSTIQKYENGVLVDKQVEKLRLETLDVYAMFPSYKGGEGFPLFLPERIANNILEQHPEIGSLEDCLGLQGFLEIQGFGINIYIANILIDQVKKGDPYNPTEPDFSEANVAYASYLHDLFGDFGILYASTLFQTNAVMTCADFDSEFFKIKAYLSNELRSLSLNGIDCSVLKRDSRGQDFVLYEEPSRTLMGIYEKNFQNNGPLTYFDGNPWVLSLGVLLCALAFGWGCYTFLGKGVKRHDGELLHGVFLASVPFFVLQLFAAIFFGIFGGNSTLIGYCFSSLSLVSVCFFLIQVVAFLFASGYRKEKTREND